MFRLFRRSARLLIAAGVVGVACSSVSLLAQTPPGLNSIQVTSSQIQLEAMKVEMALLADHHTFQLPLSVRVGTNGLELSGRVGDDRLREQALRVARSACYLPVMDALELATSRPTQTVNAAAMKRAVHDVLTGTMGDRLQSLDVRVSQHGEVTLSGSTPSVEDKLAASRALRTLPGCQAVFNSLSVQTHQQAGHTITLVTRDGQHAVHGVLPAAVTAVGTEPTVTPVVSRNEEVASPIHLPPAPSPTIPTGLPPAREIYVRLRSANQVHPVMYVAPSSGYATPHGPVAVSVVSPAMPAQAAGPVQAQPPAQKCSGGLLDRFARGGKAPATQCAACAAPTPAPAVAAVAVSPHAAPPYATAPASRTWQVGYPVSNAQPGREERPAVMKHATAIRQAAKPDGRQVAPTLAEPPATPAPPATAVAQAPPLSTLTPTAAQGEPLPAIGQPASALPTTTAPQPAAPKPVPAASKPLTPAKVESLVWSVCGKQVKSVKVQPSADGRHMVHIHPVAGMDQEVLSKLMAVPEITGSELRLQIHLSN